MVDIVSEATSGRTIRRISASFRLPSFLPKKTGQIAPPDGEFREPAREEHVVRVFLEIQEDKANGTSVYRLIDANSGAVLQEWRGDQLGDLRKFLQENRIQFVDRRV